ncbi:MAG: hypothetical protein NW237_17565 [Cyanobacteriota bacterium]|nr:hypothetical protein [Cyanobacteriota bacterium]
MADRNQKLIMSEYDPSHKVYWAVTEQFQKIRDISDITVKNYLIAGYHIQLNFIGSSLVDCLTPAFAHLSWKPSDQESSSQSSQPALTIFIWDAHSTNMAIPSLGISHADYWSAGQVANNCKDHIKVTIGTQPKVINILDFRSQQGIFWMESIHDFENYDISYERAAPLVRILLWWLERKQLFFLHAAAVGTSQSCILIVGDGGAGKSTTALACWHQGMNYISDDFCMVSLEPDPRVFSLYNTGKLSLNSQKLFERLDQPLPSFSFWDHEKAVLFTAQHTPERVMPSLPIKAILMPQIVDSHSSQLILASPTQGIRTLAPSTLRILTSLAGSRDWTFTSIGKLVKQLPVYQFKVGQDLKAVYQCVFDLLLS